MSYFPNTLQTTGASSVPLPTLVSPAPGEIFDARRRLRPFRLAVIACASLLLIAGSRQLLSVPFWDFTLLALLIFLSRCVPVALTREKPVTFTASCVFATALLLNGVAAGLSALLACTLHARYFRRGGHSYAVFIGAQYALAALATHGVFLWLHAQPLLKETPTLNSLRVVLLATCVFILVNTLVVGLGNIGTRYSRRSYAEAVLRTSSLVYLISFPLAALLIFLYEMFGLAALPCLVGPLLICAHAVRTTIENRTLKYQLHAVRSLGQTCTIGVREEVPLQRFLAQARDLLAFERAILWLADEESLELRPRVAFPEQAHLPTELGTTLESCLNRAIARKEPLLIPRSRSASSQEGNPVSTEIGYSENGEAWALYPIVLHGRSIGVAQFIRSAARPFTRPEVARLAALVPQAAIAFESVRLRHLMHRYQDMMRHYQDMAQTDGLTGLYNHRRSQELLRDEIARASRYQRALSVLMLDVDFFKQFNDTYGHPQGDVLLRSIANILSSCVRSTDFVGRYGGEEFIVILPETAGGDAYILAERIRAAVEAEWFPIGDGYGIHKTISVGVASFPNDAETAAELLQHADAALYRAKRTGKNRVLTA